MKKDIPKLEATFNIDKLQGFIDVLKDLTKIDDKIVLRFHKNGELVIYSMVGKNGLIYGFKSQILKQSDYFKKIPVITDDIRILLKDMKKFIANISFYLEDKRDLKLVIEYNEDFIGDTMNLSDGKQKLNIIGDSPAISNIDIDIDSNLIKNNINTNTPLYSFDITKSDFDRIKKLSQIEGSTNEVYYFKVENNKVSIGENKWSLELGDANYKDDSITFIKKYFNAMTFSGDKNTVHVYDANILVTNSISDLLISTELCI